MIKDTLQLEEYDYNAVETLVSLHTDPHQIIITSLMDFSITRKICLPYMTHALLVYKNSE